jgi:formylglycine-generating enzyme required for sulfatase activity
MSGLVSESYRVTRGGSWFYGPRNARVANRDYDAPGYRYDTLGFRLVRRAP